VICREGARADARAQKGVEHPFSPPLLLQRGEKRLF
jgi:hypothetical protein